MPDLRTRIAAATVGHADYVSGLTRYCTCGQWSGDSTGTRIDFSRHLADAVIAELGLRPQHHELLTRYITNWTHTDNTK